jgi:hypothetical protein
MNLEVKKGMLLSTTDDDCQFLSLGDTEANRLLAEKILIVSSKTNVYHFIFHLLPLFLLLTSHFFFFFLSFFKKATARATP